MSRTGLLLGAAVIAVGALLFYRENYKDQTPTKVENLQAHQTSGGMGADDMQFQDWHEFSAPNGEFKVLFPSLPQHAAETINDPKTKEARQYDMYVAQKADGTIFMISLIKLLGDAPAKLEENMLPAVINDMMEASPKSKLKLMQMGRYKDFPSIDFSYENEQVNVDGKAFISGNTLFLLTSVANIKDYHKPEFDFYINSFQMQTASK